jgi:hypothetical protein
MAIALPQIPAEVLKLFLEESQYSSNSNTSNPMALLYVLGGLSKALVNAVVSASCN